MIQGKELCPPLHLGVVAFKKGAFGSLLTMVTKFTYGYISLTIQLNIGHYTQLNDQTVLFLTI